MTAELKMLWKTHKFFVSCKKPCFSGLDQLLVVHAPPSSSAWGSAARSGWAAWWSTSSWETPTPRRQWNCVRRRKTRPQLVCSYPALAFCHQVMPGNMRNRFVWFWNINGICAWITNNLQTVKIINNNINTRGLCGGLLIVNLVYDFGSYRT